MLKATFYSGLCYATSAVAFLVFTMMFIRRFGVAPYADFSILLNTLSALTLLGNYHGYLVSYSVAIERAAFRQYLVRAALPYVAVVTAPAVLAYATVTGLPLELAPATSLLLALLFAAGMPVAVIMASQNNWRVNAYRAVYQVCLVACFWVLFATSQDTERSFIISGLVAAVVFLSLLFGRANRELRPTSELPAASPLTLLVSAVGNISLMLTLLTDKFALNHLSVGADRQLVGLYMLYYDILSRASAIYVITVCPLTYHLLDRIRRSEAVGPILLRLAIGAIALGAACVVVGYFFIPIAYGTSIVAAPMLPLWMAVLVAGQGFGSILGAYCNAAGRGQVLMWQNIAVFTLVAIAIGLLEWRGAGFSVTQLAFVLALGNGLNGFTLVCIALAGSQAEMRTNARLRKLAGQNRRHPHFH